MKYAILHTHAARARSRCGLHFYVNLLGLQEVRAVDDKKTSR